MKSNNERTSGILSFLRNNRITVSLLCLCLIGGLAIYSFHNALEKTGMTDTAPDSGIQTENPSDISVSGEIPVTDSRNSSDDSSADNGTSGISSEKADKGSSASIMPAEGTISKDYTGDNLAYSKTLNQYICHKAVDISAPAGSAVTAVESGTVISSEEDDRYGLTITISHGEGLETSYSCLGDAACAIGDVVTKGDKIGTIGEDALFESADGPHLHFEVRKDGLAVNPHDLWNW